MSKTPSGRLLIYYLALLSATLGTPSLSHAGAIGTQALLQLEERQARVERIDAVLSGTRVQEALIQLGVNPSEVKARVAALTDEELMTLEKDLNALPAGGQSIFLLAGVVFIVLLILDAVGVTNVFRGIGK